MNIAHCKILLNVMNFLNLAGERESAVFFIMFLESALLSGVVVTIDLHYWYNYLITNFYMVKAISAHHFIT